MSNLNFNKTAGGVLVALLIAVSASVLSDKIFAPQQLEKQAYVVEGVVSTANAQESGASKSFAKGEDFAKLVASADVVKGTNVAKKCTACHSFEAGGANKIGPALYGIVGKNIASASGFSKYSEGLKAIEGSWDIEKLNLWLHNPKEFVAKNNMSFMGIPKDEDRAALVAYLQSLK